MKQRILILTAFIFGFSSARAASLNSFDQKKARNDLSGVVVRSENKKPLKDVSVTVFSPSKKEKVVLTDESGNFSFDELKPGTYKFVFEKSGFRKVIKEKVAVKTEDALPLMIEMVESNDFDMMPSPFHFFNV
ncbi:MAG: carboxypeptidase regulatory-like domain-containing protein [Bacteroidetes bacterium]|nr:carboxypeptidase regulatory-like domain-containing protein [Bacteroidota bacterium]MBS1631140.1 carboxypeptidase regulatory-like domain-containing protein [Bacteroidota bacterium]